MELITYLLPYIQLVIACVILKYSCDLFEQSAGYLGRNMPAGIKGATINAVGSSMPEMMSSFAVLFFMDDPITAFGIALGITAGSGVFNTAFISSVSVLFARDKDGNPVDGIPLDRYTLIRDGFWVVVSDIALILLIAHGSIHWSMALLLNSIYVGYAIHLYIDSKRMGTNKVSEYEDEQLEDYGTIGNILTFNFNKVLFGGRVLNGYSAVTLLAISISILTAASHILVLGVDGLAGPAHLDIPPFISGLIFGAASSSVPDLILSVKDARNGNNEDAIANPLASNTFCTSLSVGLPVLLWLLWMGESSIPVLSAEENMTALRISVVCMSATVCATLIAKYKGVTKRTAWLILGCYLVWCAWIAYTFFDV